MKSTVVRRLVERYKTEGKRSKEIAKALKEAGYLVFVASFCFCEDVVFFDTHEGVQIRLYS
ncbi:MAG: hypothetical protein COZ20_03695 [Gallionellales bacterium CG_4_10_14_3_um_filter_54_96]|nr:MAG: hypothetical protein COS43_01815 [Gallionellales bacterium CG03_land_8_20_14_0_80_55_15]PIX03703.1 MAG: hypothetical protein COZ77_10365 [Gallionellales bacterium CG_4_8_14_3_um_filter_54_18]PIY05234.1 MAG: hypothetical protein COZ20_03695 [Gallionellales bacterium CG_4_10_14_3_um_filter_54_96]